ncbi:hypothetical protein MKX01_030580 [Papaver californicum]|nr:hypothetical protein MKX01_030580 [Papaver californicum]
MLPGARSVPEEQVRIVSTKMDGIGSQKAIQIRSRLGISGKIKIKELTKSQIGQIEEIIGQDHVVHWVFKREECRLLLLKIKKIEDFEDFILYF